MLIGRRLRVGECLLDEARRSTKALLDVNARMQAREDLQRSARYATRADDLANDAVPSDPCALQGMVRQLHGETLRDLGAHRPVGTGRQIDIAVVVARGDGSEL